MQGMPEKIFVTLQQPLQVTKSWRDMQASFTWNRPSQSQASEMSLVLRSTGSSLIISISGGSDMGVPVGAPLPSSMIPAEDAIFRSQSMDYPLDIQKHGMMSRLLLRLAGQMCLGCAGALLS